MGSLKESASFCQDVTTRQPVASVYWYSNPHYSANPAGVYSHFFFFRHLNRDSTKQMFPFFHYLQGQKCENLLSVRT